MDGLTMRQGFMSVTVHVVFFTNFYIRIRWRVSAGSLWCFISNRILDFLLTSLELAYCSEGRSCCHSHRVKYSSLEASRLQQNCIKWLYVHNAGNINSICWCSAMRSVVKWHQDTRDAMFLCKPRGRCKMHYSYQIVYLIIYDLWPYGKSGRGTRKYPHSLTFYKLELWSFSE